MGGVQLMTAFTGVRRRAMALVLVFFVLVGLGAGASVSAQESGGEVKGNLVPVSYTHLTLPTICSV